MAERRMQRGNRLATLGSAFAAQFSSIQDILGELYPDRGPIRTLKSATERLGLPEMTCLTLPVAACRELLHLHYQAASGPKHWSKLTARDWQAELRSERQPLELLKAILAGMVRMLDTVHLGVAVALGIYTQVHYGWYLGLPLYLVAITLYWERLAHPNPWVVSRQRVVAYLLAFIPALEFLCIYLAAHDVANRVRAANSAKLAAVVFVIAVLSPVAFLRLKSRAYNAKVGRYFWSMGIPGLVRPVGKQIEFLLREVASLQISGRSIHRSDERIRLFAAFDVACIAYLRGRATRDEVVDHRQRALRRDSPVQENRPGKLPDSGVDVSPFHETPSPRLGGDSGTLEIAIELGLSEADAHYIAMRVPTAQANSVIQQLKAVCPEGYREILLANPEILCWPRSDREHYISTLHETLNALDGQSTDESTGIQCTPMSLATFDGLAFVRERLLNVTPQSQGTHRDEALLSSVDSRRYKSKTLLRALLCKGFELSTSSPRIGMNYKSFLYIKTATQHHVDPAEMVHFDATFKNLLSDGVILRDKQHKGGGGRFPGCYSITPSSKEIRREDLRLLVREYLYGLVPQQASSQGEGAFA